MNEAIPTLLTSWETFYVIVGTGAAALTGLQFVVIVLGAEVGALSSQAMRAFGTPTIVHFCTVLLISAVLSAPWHDLSNVGIVIAVAGVIGVLYMMAIVQSARRQTVYVPVLEDWLWHGVFPTLGYAVLLVSGLELGRHAAPSLFAVGAVAVLLLFIGIHNAWDSVTYIAIERRRRAAAESEPAGAAEATPE
ncbi:MAG: hypothetical protein IRY91_15270 [Gemmatimonadaceae bacterium]|nr:hypothetical protein [Gemmatimonadaceae bacterium]